MTASMSSSTVPAHDELIGSVEEQLAKRGVTEPEFVRGYYKHVPVDELRERPLETLVGAAGSQRALAEQRPAGSANVRVFNPATDADGWTSPRTTVMVVTDDMPFLVDSVTGVLVAEGYDIHLVIHPQVLVRRDAEGHFEAFGAAAAAEAGRVAGEIPESWMLLSIDRESDPERMAALEDKIRSVLEDVRVAVEDWSRMRTKCLVVAAELEGSAPKDVDAGEVRQAADFLRWMADNHFTFLGYREYSLAEVEGGEAIVSTPGTGLGILRTDQHAGAAPLALSEPARAQAHARDPLVLTKANSRATVHRNAYLDYVGVKTFDEAGEVVGERRFLGLYASTAYTESVTRIPLVADKVRSVVERSGVASDSHTGKDLLEVLENFPRDELFQAGVDDLYETAMSVTQLQERRRTKLFVREDAFGRFASCLVYIPRDRYNTSVRTRMAELLRSAFDGESVEFTARVSESALSRLQFVVRMAPGRRVRHLDESERVALEERLVELSRTWSDRLGDSVRSSLGEVEGDRVIRNFGRGFSTAYEETFSISQGVADLSHLDRLGADQGTSVALYKPADTPDDIRRFKLFRIDPLSLTEVLPIFTHMGVEVVDERPYEVARADGQPLHVYDFGLRAPDASVWRAMPHEELRQLFEGAVLAVWSGQAESDNLNRLVLGAHLTCRQVVILRTIARYLRQARATFSPAYLEGALVANPAIARALVRLFETRFDPAGGDPPRRGAHAGGGRDRRRGRGRARLRGLARPRPDHPLLPRRHQGDPAHQLLPARRRQPRTSTSPTSRSSSTPRRCPTCRRRGRSSRSGSTGRGSRASTSASGRSPAAACAGATGARTSAPRSSASSRRRWSRTP